VGAGVIDPDYRGEVKVLLFNHDTHSAFIIKPGDRIAQLILERFEVASEISRGFATETSTTTTDRGEGGFGSTGVQ
jgi:dUTP pyrophosphatase